MNLTEEILDAAGVAARKAVRTALSSFVRYGTVDEASPLTVLLDGDNVSVPIRNRASSYTPGDGDRVILLRLGAVWVAVCSVVTS